MTQQQIKKNDFVYINHDNFPNGTTGQVCVIHDDGRYEIKYYDIESKTIKTAVFINGQGHLKRFADDLNKWMKQKSKYQFKCIKVENKMHITKNNIVPYYTVLYLHLNKVRLGELNDGMYVRFGIDVRATLSRPCPTGLWIGSGGCSDKEFEQMIDMWHGENLEKIPNFHVLQLRDLEH